MKDILEKLINKKNLNFEESKSVFEKIMTGQVQDELIEKFLILLSEKGESSEEIAGGVFVLRNKAKEVKITGNAIDTCGTGGDGKNTLNISTASAILLSSLESINKFNFGFMFAPNYHSAMIYVGPIRKKIGKRTIFNLIGPLSSPAKVNRQIVGVFDKKLLRTFADALKNLNIKFAWIVNSEDGLDEISPFAKTNIVELKNNSIKEFSIDPKDLKININNFENIIGKDAEYNSKKIEEIFKGKDNEFSIAVSLNAAAGLIISERETNFAEAYKKIRNHILSGNVYEHLKKITNF